MMPSLCDLVEGRISKYLPIGDYSKAMRDEMDSHTDQGRIKINREVFLKELRSDKWKKGCTKSDERGNPIIESPEDDAGTCACSIMIHLFDPLSVTSTLRARAALGITGHDCFYIQHCLNDSLLGFPEIADIIERTVFSTVNPYEDADVIRAGGECICTTCNHPYSHHPSLARHSWVTILCDGMLVKL